MMGTGFAQLVRRPFGATTQVAGVRLPCLAVAPVRGAVGLGLAPAPELGLGLGGVDGAAPASAPPTATPTASTPAVRAASHASVRFGRCEPVPVMTSSCTRRSGPRPV